MRIKMVLTNFSFQFATCGYKLKMDVENGKADCNVRIFEKNSKVFFAFAHCCDPSHSCQDSRIQYPTTRKIRLFEVNFPNVRN